MPVIKEKVHAAKQYYRCDDCGGWIMPGEHYSRLFGMAEKYEKPYELKLCKKCRTIEGKDDEK